MPIHDQDTDPSTPDARRGLATTDPTPNPATHVSTDPGLGPGSHPPPPGATPPGGAAVPGMPGVPLKATQPLPPMTPMGIVVPAASQVKPRKDSVELLLDGMQGPLPERPRLTPQTDGESHAAYHAQHQVHPSRTNPNDEPKVVVDRPALPATQKIDRSRVQAVIEEADARRRAGEATAVLPKEVAPRMVVAVVAGLVVVLAIFVVVGLAGKGSDGAAKTEPVRATATAAATAIAAPTATAPATQTAGAATSSAASVASSEPTPATSATTTTAAATTGAKAAPPPWATAPGSARAKAPKAAATGTGELQDYQTKF